MKQEVKNNQDLGGSFLPNYEEKFTQLHCDAPGGHPRPHKAVMLLAVSLLAEADELPENRIEYNPRLLDIFRSLFEVARMPTDQNTPYNPFFYLKSEGFWHLDPADGQEAVLPHIRTLSGPGQLREMVACARLDPELFDLLRNPASRTTLQGILIQRYCSHAADAVWERLKEESRIETRRQHLLCEERSDYPDDTEPVRSAAFRRMIREIYDIRCAACGVRFFFDDVDLIDAAHLIPFSQSRDDRPQNGIALCKNHHWLMDHAIIAPGPGRSSNYQRPVWHVRQGLDERFEEHRPVLELKGKTVILPAQPCYTPARESLDWRMATLKAG